MSDARRVDIIEGGAFETVVADDPEGTHALLPWEEYEGLRATELAHASTITELSLKVGDLQTQLAAKDAVVEAAWKAVNKSVYPLDFLEDALRALKPCETCGGSGEVELPFLHPSAPGTADCPDCGGDDE